MTLWSTYLCPNTRHHRSGRKYWDLGRILFYPNTKEVICRTQKQHHRATPYCKASIPSFLWGSKDAFPSYTLLSHTAVKERHPDDHQHGSPQFSGTQWGAPETMEDRICPLFQNMYSYLKTLSLFGEQQKCCYQHSGLSRSNFAIGTSSGVTD